MFLIQTAGISLIMAFFPRLLFADDLGNLKKVVAVQAAEIARLKNATAFGQITLLNSNDFDAERLAIPHPIKTGWVQFLSSKDGSVIAGEERALYTNETLPGKGWTMCNCSLSYFEAGTCGGINGRRNLGRGRGQGSGSSYGELRGFTCSYDPQTGGLIAGVWWANQTGCNSIGVSWTCRR